MKTLFRNLKNGQLSLTKTPMPQLEAQGVIVRNHFSLISSGTERNQVAIDKMSMINKARSRPDLVRQVLHKVKNEGFKNTYNAVQARLGTPQPLGYSCAGEVLEAGEMVSGLRTGDFAACNGGGFACHSEVIYAPGNLAAPLPRNLDLRMAATAGVGAIALHGVRQSQAKLGETIAVIGMGLIGQMTAQMLEANGCNVIGIDLFQKALDHSRTSCPSISTCLADDEKILDIIQHLTSGLGVDATIVCSSSGKGSPIDLAADITRENGKVIIVGLMNMALPREKFFRKELNLIISRSTGPGRFDQNYEEKGLDYPANYVRWTEGRNVAAYLALAAKGRINPLALITHEFPFDKAIDAYNLLADQQEFYVGILLKYDTKQKHLRSRILPGKTRTPSSQQPGISLIGAGSYATKHILPYLRKTKLNLVVSGKGTGALAAAQRFDLKGVTDDQDIVINDETTEAVIITTRHNKHASAVISALSKKIKVFVEKPLCLTIRELSAIKAGLSKESYLQVGYNRRYAKPSCLVKARISDREPRLQMLLRVNAGVLKNHWLKDPIEGGGRLLGEACHQIDISRFFAGSPIKQVHCTSLGNQDRAAIETENFSILLEFENGAYSNILYSGSGGKALTKERYELFSDGETVVMEDFKKVIFYNNKEKTVKYANQEKGFAEQMAAFCQGIQTGRQPVPDEEIIEITLAGLAALESLTRNAPVTMLEMQELLEEN